jgi:hypothetical protein
VISLVKIEDRSNVRNLVTQRDPQVFSMGLHFGLDTADKCNRVIKHTLPGEAAGIVEPVQQIFLE